MTRHFTVLPFDLLRTMHPPDLPRPHPPAQIDLPPHTALALPTAVEAIDSINRALLVAADEMGATLNAAGRCYLDADRIGGR